MWWYENACMQRLRLQWVGDISPSDAFEAASMCEGCLGGDISNCSTQVQGQLKCADIRDHLKCVIL